MVDRFQREIKVGNNVTAWCGDRIVAGTVYKTGSDGRIYIGILDDDNNIIQKHGYVLRNRWYRVLLIPEHIDITDIWPSKN
jgi:hypothetical protein